MGMAAKKSPLVALITFPKNGSDEARRDILRSNTDAFITATDRYGARDKEYIDLLFSRSSLLMDKKLRRCLAMALAKSGVSKDLVKNILERKTLAVTNVLRRSTTQSIPELTNMIRERSSQKFNAPQRLPVNPETLLDGNKFTLPKLLMEEVFRYTYFSLRHEISALNDDETLATMDRTCKRFRARILEESQTEARTEILSIRKEISRRKRYGELNEDYISELLLTEHATEFVLALSAILKIDNATMLRVLNDTSWEALAIACRAAGISRALFANLVNNMNRREADEESAVRIISLYSNISDEAATRVMRFWQVRALALKEAQISLDPVDDDIEEEVAEYSRPARRALFGSARG